MFADQYCGEPARDDWIPYAAKYATLPPLPAHLALPAPVWPFLSSVVLLYLQPTLLTALANHMAWPTATEPTFPNAIHFSGFSAGSYTAIALEAEYKGSSTRLQQPLCPGCATLTHLPARAALVTSEQSLRIIHLWDDQLCPWHPSLAEIVAVTTPPHSHLPTAPASLPGSEGDARNYAHLLQDTVPRCPALFAVQASLTDLCAYSASFVPPDALEELTAHLSCAPQAPHCRAVEAGCGL